MKVMIKLKKLDKIVGGVKVGERYAAVVIVDKDGNAELHDCSEVDWREVVDCGTLSVHEIDVPI